MDREQFKQEVPDLGLRDYILTGIDISPDMNPFSTVTALCTCFRNLINLSFMYAFSCYQDVANRDYSPDGESILESCIKGGNSNSARVLNNMKKIYNGYPITNELVQYILLDIYFDFELGKESYLCDIFPDFINIRSGARLDEIFAIINKTANSTRAANDYKKKDLRELLLKALHLFPFLRTSKLVFMPDRMWYAIELDRGVAYEYYPEGMVNTFGTVIKIGYGDVGDFHYLSDMRLTNTDNASLIYTKVGTNDFVLSRLAGELSECDNGYSRGVLSEPFEIPHDGEFFCSMLAPDRLESIKPVTADYSIEQLFNIKYKYIKNLALAIADTLGRPSIADHVKSFKEEFKKRVPLAFKRYKESENNWDTVVLMLIIETSPSFVLQRIFSLHGQINSYTASLIIENLTKRFGEEFSKNLQEHIFGAGKQGRLSNPGKMLAEYAEKLVHIKTYNKKVPAYNELQINCVAEKMADIILSCIIRKDDNTPVYFCIGNTRQNIEALEALKDETDVEERCSGIYRAFGELLMKLTCFYEGIYAYGREKMVFDSQSAVQILSAEVIKEFQNRAEEAFSLAAEAEYTRIKSLSDGCKLIPIINEFAAVCEKCYECKANAYKCKAESYALHSVLGKNDVLDIRSLNEERADLVELAPNTASFWIEQALEFIKFFRTGSFRSKSNDISLFSAIIPFIAGYNESKYNKDGYQTAMFTLVFSKGDERGGNEASRHEVNVLSEFQYNMNSKYYCLPNIATSTGKWWIDPFIIKCQAFDEIFEER